MTITARVCHKSDSLVAIDEGMVLDQTPGERSCDVRQRRVRIIIVFILGTMHGTLQKTAVPKTVRSAVEVKELFLNRFDNFYRREVHYLASSRIVLRWSGSILWNAAMPSSRVMVR